MKMNTHSLFGGFAPGVFALSHCKGASVQKLVVVVVVLPEAKSLINCLAGYAPLIFFFCAIFLIARQTTAHLVAFLRVLYRGC